MLFVKNILWCTSWVIIVFGGNLLSLTLSCGTENEQMLSWDSKCDIYRYPVEASVILNVILWQQVWYLMVSCSSKCDTDVYPVTIKNTICRKYYFSPFSVELSLSTSLLIVSHQLILIEYSTLQYHWIFQNLGIVNLNELPQNQLPLMQQNKH